MLDWIFKGSIFILIWKFIGFPLSLLIKAHGNPDQKYPDQLDEDLPSVSLLIAAKNEEDTIGAKLENSLALDYPQNKLEIVVMANGCTDKTAEIVRSFKNRGIKLQEYGNIGKVAAQNFAARRSHADILAFSDANTPYRNNALRELVKPFQDNSVGSVCGNHVYRNEGDPRSATEGVLWNISETKLKKAESRTGGTIGANGAIYAVRSDLYRHLPDGIISDFWEPMIIASAGRKTVYAENAIAYETIEDRDLKVEYIRKARIVQRSVYSLLRFRWILNPIQYPRLSWLVINHKILRWLTPFFLFAALVAALLKILLGTAGNLEKGYFLSATFTGFLALLGRGLARDKTIPVLSHAYYAFLMLGAAARGVFLGTRPVQVWDRAR